MKLIFVFWLEKHYNYFCNPTILVNAGAQNPMSFLAVSVMGALYTINQPLDNLFLFKYDVISIFVYVTLVSSKLFLIMF